MSEVTIATRSKDEGFTLTGSGSLNHPLQAFAADRGTSKTYDWELGGDEGFTLTGSGSLDYVLGDAL